MREIFERASIRKFLPKEVEEEKIKKLLEAAMSSPSAMNGRPWEFYVVKNKTVLEALSNATPYAMCVKNAPAAIVITYHKTTPAYDFHDIDCAIATENILLELVHLDLGGVMIGVSPIEENQKNVKEILNLKDEEEAFTIIPFGYKGQEKEQGNRYEERKAHVIE